MSTPELREVIDVLDKCWQLAFRQPLPYQQLILLTDVSFQSAECAVLTEDDPNWKFTSTRKFFASIASGSKAFTP